MSEQSFTPGVEWVIVQEEDIGERSRGLTYLMANGNRRRVVIDSSLDSPDLRKRMGDAFVEGRVSRTKGRTP